MHSIIMSRGVGVVRVRGVVLQVAALLLGAMLGLSAAACRIGTSECAPAGESGGALTGDGGGGEGGGSTGGTGAGGDREAGAGGSDNLCAHFGETCVDAKGVTGKVGAANATTCVCCTGCFGLSGRCEPGLINTACGGGGEVCADCMSRGCGVDQACHALCYDEDGVILPNGTPCDDEANGPGHCLSGTCQHP